MDKFGKFFINISYSVEINDSNMQNNYFPSHTSIRLFIIPSIEIMY